MSYKFKLTKNRILLQKLSFLAIIVLFATIFTGCSNNKNQTVTENATLSHESEESLISLYYVEGNNVVAADEKYQLKQPDSISNSVDEVMTAREFPDTVIYNNFAIDEYNNVAINLGIDSSIPNENLLLNKAALVSTLSQIEGINNIELIICSLDGEVIEDNKYTADSFFYYDSKQSENMNNGEAELYLPNDDGNALKRVLASVSLDTNESVEKSILDLLITYGAMPEGTKVNNIYVKTNVCYVDLSQEFLNDNRGIKSEVVVYSIVNTLTSLPNISSVQLLVDGNKEATYRETVSINGLLQYKGGLLN